MEADVSRIPSLKTGKAAKRRREGAKERTQYENEVKLKIIQKHFREENPVSIHSLSRQYKIARSTLIGWKKQYELIEIQAKDRPKRKRVVAINRILPFPQLEDKLF